jgi:hypothetical protein
MGDRAGRLAALDGDRAVPAAIGPQERLAAGVEARRPLRAGEVGEVVAPLTVLGLVVDDPVFDLDRAPRSFVSLARQTSSVSPRGTRYRVSLWIPARREAMTV